eukprot:comp19433_c0_seq1/m.22544 comp19433_c0_seq1/g.22544  ORF comp19433_c0_seq1/g.22544 comp19433_c0_seq1/m.22544 type:complete len:1206 (-) comp19433_c0_seq1:531-4148(-)
MSEKQRCAKCQKYISAFDARQSFGDKVYHHICFVCATCNNPPGANSPLLELEEELYCAQHFHQKRKLQGGGSRPASPSTVPRATSQPLMPRENEGDGSVESNSNQSDNAQPGALKSPPAVRRERGMSLRGFVYAPAVAKEEPPYVPPVQQQPTKQPETVVDPKKPASSEQSGCVDEEPDSPSLGPGSPGTAKKSPSMAARGGIWRGAQSPTGSPQQSPNASPSVPKRIVLRKAIRTDGDTEKQPTEAEGPGRPKVSFQRQSSDVTSPEKKEVVIGEGETESSGSRPLSIVQRMRLEAELRDKEAQKDMAIQQGKAEVIAQVASTFIPEQRERWLADEDYDIPDDEEGTGIPCFACHKRIPVTRIRSAVNVDNTPFHPKCARCAKCQVKLNSTNAILVKDTLLCNVHGFRARKANQKNHPGESRPKKRVPAPIREIRGAQFRDDLAEASADELSPPSPVLEAPPSSTFSESHVSAPTTHATGVETRSKNVRSLSPTRIPTSQPTSGATSPNKLSITLSSLAFGVENASHTHVSAHTSEPIAPAQAPKKPVVTQPATSTNSAESAEGLGAGSTAGESDTDLSGVMSEMDALMRDMERTLAAAQQQNAQPSKEKVASTAGATDHPKTIEPVPTSSTPTSAVAKCTSPTPTPSTSTVPTTQQPQVDPNVSAEAPKEESSELRGVTDSSEITDGGEDDDDDQMFPGLQEVVAHTKDMSRSEHCSMVIKELQATEASYANDLQDVYNGYVVEMAKVMGLPQVELNALFGNIKELYEFHRVFVTEMTQAGLNKRELGKLFVKNEEVFYELYTTYCNNTNNQEVFLRERESLEAFKTLLKTCQKNLGHSLPLPTYLLKPVQRVLRYSMLLKEIVKYSTDDDDVECVQALHVMERVSAEINEAKRRHELEEALARFKRNLIGVQNLNFPAFGPLMKLGKVKTTRKGDFIKHERVVGLFRDTMLMCKVEKGDKCSIKETVNTQQIYVKDIPDIPFSMEMATNTNSKKTTTYVLTCLNSYEKDEWFRVLAQAAQESYLYATQQRKSMGSVQSASSDSLDKLTQASPLTSPAAATTPIESDDTRSPAVGSPTSPQVDSEDELKKEKAKKRSSTMGFFRKTLRRKDDGSDKDRPLSTSSLSFDSRDSDGVDDTQIIEDEAVSTKSSNRNSISSVFFGSNSQSSTSLASAGAASGVVPREKKGDRNSMNRTSTASSDSQ